MISTSNADALTLGSGNTLRRTFWQHRDRDRHHRHELWDIDAQ
ncbi:MAG: hypothetical protein R2849_05375 [Thermomicrobiales bacterium]